MIRSTWHLGRDSFLGVWLRSLEPLVGIKIQQSAAAFDSLELGDDFLCLGHLMRSKRFGLQSSCSPYENLLGNKAVESVYCLSQ